VTLDYSVVVPTAGRPTLARLLHSLADTSGPRAARIVIADDRPRSSTAALEPTTALPLEVVRSHGRGPAAARNAGARAAHSEWIVFLDDDVIVPPEWGRLLASDLAEARSSTAAIQGHIEVPLPRDRRPTDWERNVKGLEKARWATADMAYRRSVLMELGGFDERFSHAYREDTDLGLRTVRAGYSIELGRRCVVHPVGPSSALKSVVLQRGNADDALMRALHGRGWRVAGGVPPGRRPRHLLVSASGVAAVVAAWRRRRRPARWAATAYALGVAELAWARIAPGPRTPSEVITMIATSSLLPEAASYHWLRGAVSSLPLHLARTGGGGS
jgi:GT2 family glycosyltransferase